MTSIATTAIILTLNEELHLRRCIESVKTICDQIIIVDSGSTDATREISDECGAEFVYHPWPGYQAAQFNWALANCNIKGQWIIRLDADEYLLPELTREIKAKLASIQPNITGVYLRRRVYFKGKFIRFGGFYPIKLLRLFRAGKGLYEDVQMDEHIILSEGNTITLQNDFVDENLNNIEWWIAKHNNYSSREVRFFHTGDNVITESIGGTQEKRKRWYKQNLYYVLPPFFRAFLYFLFRYFLLLGFLDGRRGLIWHFLQACWYRFVVDVKIMEQKSSASKS